MATILITFEDAEDGTVTLKTNSDPLIATDATLEDLTQAQVAAYMTLTYIHGSVLVDPTQPVQQELPLEDGNA